MLAKVFDGSYKLNRDFLREPWLADKFKAA